MVSLAILAGSWSGNAVAQQGSGSPYELHLHVDLPVLALGITGTIAAFAQVPSARCLPSCDRGNINAFDRLVTGNYSEAAQTVADWGVLATLSLPLILNAIDSRFHGYLEDTFVYVQSLLATQTLIQLFKFAVRRPAPLVYGSSAPPDVKSGNDAARSFLSGHTAMSFAAATAFATTFWLRNPDSPWRWLVIGVGALAAGTIGALTIVAGHHFPTDVIAGALTGAAMGAMVPLTHRT